MAINKKLIHFESFENFNSKKLSANKENNKYTIGINGSILTGSPDILYQSIVYIKDTDQLWTHGNLYNGISESERTKLSEISESYTAADVKAKLLTVDGSGSKIDADLLDGVELQNILERKYSGGQYQRGAGWKRIAETLDNDSVGSCFRLFLYTSYNDAANEAYIFDISIAYNGTICIEQHAGTAKPASVTRVIDKIRVDYRPGQIAYIDVHHSVEGGNGLWWTTEGAAKSYKTVQEAELLGTAYEFTTTSGCKTDRGFYGSFHGNADSATKATQDGSGNVITTIYATKTELNDKVDKTEVYSKSEIDAILSTKVTYEFVDLGLSVKWATCNVGAEKPEDYGMHFGWGETDGYYVTEESGSLVIKDKDGVVSNAKSGGFTWSDYTLCNGSSSTMTKYCTNSSYGTVDNKTVLEQSDDAAYVSDRTCRMPTKAEIKELINGTTSAWTANYNGSGVSGMIFTSKVDTSKSIFIPAAGGVSNGSLSGVGSQCNLWSSSLNEYLSNVACFWYCNDSSDVGYNDAYYRFHGFSVRPVQDASSTGELFNPKNYYTKEEVDNALDDKLSNLDAAIVEITGDTVSLSPNVFYKKIDTSESLTIELEDVADPTIINEYHLEFSTPVGGTLVSVPDNIIWENEEMPSFRNKSVYRMDIINGLGKVSEYHDVTIIRDDYLTITALEDGLTAKLSNACEYCVDEDGNWITLEKSTATPVINAGQMLSFRGRLTPTASAGIGTFVVSKKFNLSGNCMSMLFGDNAKSISSLSGYNYAFRELFAGASKLRRVSKNILPATTLAGYCYQSMFSSCISLVNAPELPATTAVQGCYKSMFNNCRSLTQAPELPATTVLHGTCYSNMFYGCTSLTTAPALPATTLVPGCYQQMFYGCTSLTTALELPATTLADNCYGSMFYGCTSLTTAPALPATTLFASCYAGMFTNCTSLTTAPELPATTLASYCYTGMFSGCTKLNYIKALFTTDPGDLYTSNWVSGVSSTGTFVKSSAATWHIVGENGVPEGWTVEYTFVKITD